MKGIGDVLAGIEVKAPKPQPKRSGRSTSEERAKRLLDAAEATQAQPDEIFYQHSVLAQTSLPYRNPGNEVRVWERSNGTASLQVAAGSAMHPELCRLVPLGLPYGPKPRLILAHLNSEALRCQSPVIEVEDSLTAFVKRLRLSTDGRTIGTIKDQLTRLAASSVTLGLVEGGRAITVNSRVVTAFDLWLPKEDGQRVFWPSTVRLSHEYFESLVNHAVPLHDRALSALSGSAMALDVYAWLAQRLHRIDSGRRVLVPWTALKEQFGWHYDRMDKFKAVFRQTLRDVHSQYQAAAIELDGRGMTLRQSAPPVAGRTVGALPAP